MKGTLLLAVGLGLAAVCVLIPFPVLRTTGGFTGCYLFWSAATLVVIVGAADYTARWRNAG
jgi:hypothetical protein